MILRRDRFGGLVRRQLDLFAEDEADLLREAVDAERRYDEAEREDAEEAYGDLQLVFEAIGDQLEELRDTYAATLEDDTRVDYERSFDRLARKRYARSFGPSRAS
jgi:hypothetical protein